MPKKEEEMIINFILKNGRVLGVSGRPKQIFSTTMEAFVSCSKDKDGWVGIPGELAILYSSVIGFFVEEEEDIQECECDKSKTQFNIL